MNEAKEYLRKIRWYDVLINSKLEELTMLECMATKITPSMNDVGGSGGGAKDKIGDAVAKIADLRSAISKDVDELTATRRKAAELLRRIKNPDYYAVLHKRYFGFKTFEQIAAEMGYSYRNVLYIHGRALQAFQRAMDKPE